MNLKIFIFLALLVLPRSALALDKKPPFETRSKIAESICKQEKLGDRNSLGVVYNSGKFTFSKAHLEAFIIDSLKMNNDNNKSLVKSYDAGFVMGILRCANELLLLPLK